MKSSFEKIEGAQEIKKQFEIRTLDWIENNCMFRKDKSYRLPYLEVIWIKHGSGILFIDLQQYKISNGTIYCITPGQFRLVQSKGALKGYYVSLSTELLHTIDRQVDFSLLATQFGNIRNLPMIEMDNETQRELEGLLIKMIIESENSLPMKSEMLRGFLSIFMIHISRKMALQIQECSLDNEHQMVRKFMTLVRKHFTTKKFVLDYADELCVTPNHLNIIVKRVSGYAASYHIQQQIIMEAKRQALEPNIRLKEVADRLGFDDHAHFSKFFKNHSGINFSSYKKTMYRNSSFSN